MYNQYSQPQENQEEAHILASRMRSTTYSR